jgi:DNA-binding transcriptional LysR family regulator
LPHAKRLLADWDLAAAAVERVRDAGRHRLVVGMSTSPGRGGLLPAIRSRFVDKYPDATLTLHQVDWDDPTAELADATSDVSFVWLPLPDPDRFQWIVLLEQPRLVAMPEEHPLASRESIHFDELLDEPILALPLTAGPLRDYWLATSQRHGHAHVIGAEITSSDETYEALVDGRGICLLDSGNAPSITRGGVVTRPVDGLPSGQLVLAWRRDRPHPLIPPYAHSALEIVIRRATHAATR